MYTLLFVCSANRCRSPIAAAMMQRCVDRAGLAKGWQISSAGTWTKHGLPPERKTRQVMRELGFDPEQHRSRSVDHQLLSTADLVILMTESQRDGLKIEFPQFAQRMILLSEFGGHPPYDIPDPVGGSLEQVRQIANQIEVLVARGLRNLVRHRQAQARRSANYK